MSTPHSLGITMSLMVKVLLVERQGSIAFSNFKVVLEENVPLAVTKTLELPVVVGRFNMLAISQEISPLSAQHWSRSALQATLFWLLLRRVMIVIGCKFWEWDLSTISINSPREVWLLHADSSSVPQSLWKRTIGEPLVVCWFSVLFWLPLDFPSLNWNFENWGWSWRFGQNFLCWPYCGLDCTSCRGNFP